MDINSTITLNNGTKIPRLGIGCWRSPSGDVTKNSVLWALEAGYRHIDTAAIYKNEADVGNAIKESGIARKDIFVTTKLWNTDSRAHRQREAFEESLDRLGLDYVDLYLIHWPVENFVESWHELEKIYRSGRAKAIGVSNFKVHHLQTLLNSAEITPAVDQMEFSPYMQDNEAVDFCRAHGIAYEAWSPLGAGPLLEEPTLVKLSQKYGKSTAQVILRWVLQRDIIVFPKSNHKERIAENADIFDFEISEEDMKLINSLNCGKRTGSDPDTFNF